MSQKITRLEAHQTATKLEKLLNKMDPFMEGIEMVREFNEAFEIPPLQKSSVGDVPGFMLKYSLMQEELDEYIHACESDDYVEVCDAVTDMMYILLGIIVHHRMEGFFFDMFEEVHKSNMSKLENGKVLRRTDGKVMKGSDYFAPNLSVIILNADG